MSFSTIAFAYQNEWVYRREESEKKVQRFTELITRVVHE